MPLTSAERAKRYRDKKNKNRKKSVPLTSVQRVQRHRNNQNNAVGKKISCLTVAQRVNKSRLNKNKEKSLQWLSDFLNKHFYKYTLNAVCCVCERLWWDNQIVHKKGPKTLVDFIKNITCISLDEYPLCKNCYVYCCKEKIPLMAKYNGFSYPEIPTHLPTLDPIAERLISPRLPFLTTRQIRWFPGAKKMVGQIINVPVDVDTMVRCLPRSLDDDYAINVNIKRHKLHKSGYLQGCVKKSVVKTWLRYLVNTPLYRKYNIYIDFREHLNEETEHECVNTFSNVQEGIIPLLEAETMLSLQQHTMLWGEEMMLILYPTQDKKPLALSFDGDAEELSFPAIYYGQQREFKTSVTPYSMALSEIRRADRRGAKPDHILYMAAKILRLRVINGYRLVFRNQNNEHLESITKAHLQDSEFVKNMLDRNLSFFKGIPNSVQYWHQRKKDLFGMLRQLGKPTIFLTLSASEIYWVPLLKTLIRFRNNDFTTEISDEEIENLSTFWRATIVNEDPVVCCLYFEKLIDTLFRAMKNVNGPFGQYVVVDYFKRIEFQHRGSPHCHCLLWLKNAPREPLSENMPETVKFLDNIISVSNFDLPTIRSVQTHRHTHTCYRKHSRKCRFNAPFWPMEETTILLPAIEKDVNKKDLYNNLHSCLETETYESFSDFLSKNLITSKDDYLNILRHGISRATIFLKRDVEDIWTNPYNAAIVNILNSNMDIQFVLDEYSCATYVAEYVNKSNRGFSALHRELVDLKDKFPDADYDTLMKELGKKTLNNIEMTTQEAAWFLLKLPMSKTSRYVHFIPTQHPSERYVSTKSDKQMQVEGLNETSTDIWNKNVIQQYEQRPEEFKHVCLAEFVACYTKIRNTKKLSMDSTYVIHPDTSDDEGNYVVNISNKYKRRTNSKIIRWRGYEIQDKLNYIRELVTLFHPFKNEELEILNNDNYIQIYENHKDAILAMLQQFDSGIDLSKILSSIVQMEFDDDTVLPEAHKRLVSVIGTDNVYHKNPHERIYMQPDGGDMDVVKRTSIIQKVQNVMTHAEFCQSIRNLNSGQYTICLELINRLIYDQKSPLQLFLTGPAGAGKTYVLKLMMDIINRFTIRHDSNKCAYLVCATTGKAAINIDGTTVHTAFNIPINANKILHIKASSLHTLRCDMREVSTIIIDEISMMSYQILNNVDYILRAVGSCPNTHFGGFNIILCGDLRQLPPVRAAPIYRRPSNCLQKEMIWHNLQYYELKEVVRQADKQFSKLLTKIGSGKSLNEREITLLTARFVNKEDITHIRDAVRLFHKNADVDNYNYNILNVDGAVEILAEDEIKGCEISQQITSTKLKIAKLSFTDTGNMHKKLLLLLNTPYILSQNIDKKDKLVNGSFGYLRFIEYDSKDTNRVKRVWIEFSNIQSGAIRRVESAYHASTLNISRNCTPICRRSAPVNLSSSRIKVKRIQFPLSPANALTVHKSQGGTYDSVVFEYSKTLHTSLVYVGLSRATSLAGLYLTNENKEHVFYHGNGNKNYNELRTEFQRLESVALHSIKAKAYKFITCEMASFNFCYLNIQSLNAHKNDIVKDEVIKCADLLALSETWINTNNIIDIDGYKLVTQYKRNEKRAAGVAIYESKESNLLECHRLDFDETHAIYGDVCCARMLTKDNNQFALVTVYANCGTSIQNMKSLMDFALWRFGENVKNLHISQVNNLSECPIILCGDLNMDLASSEGQELVNYLKNEHKLELMTNAIETTRNKTSIDYVFTKDVDINIFPYVSYFSTHRPLLGNIKKKSSCRMYIFTYV